MWRRSFGHGAVRRERPVRSRGFHSSPEVIRLVVLLYVRFPLPLRIVEDLLFERDIDICHETVRLWRKRFGPLFAADVRRQRVSRMRGTPAILSRCDARDRQSRSAGNGALAQQSRGKFTSAVSPTRAGDAAISPDEVAAEIRLGSCFAIQSLQFGTTSR